VFFSDHVDRRIPARSGKIQVLRILNDLLKRPKLERTPVTNLTPLLQAGLGAFKKRSLIFIISDFISLPGWEKPMTLLNQRHEVIAVRLWDPSEAELPDLGAIIMEDAETGEQIYVDTHDLNFRTRFKEATLQRESALKQIFDRSGVDLLSISTEEDMVRAIVRFAAQRRQHQR
jgi:uncharacterized protein (DUF58 family)